ncbi:hypothetical protein KVH22_30020 [Streptomyces olivaceus]|uniref:hypothetical protein n=1 Tax=Streptomyces olivaceus TaxID=47716 RepID=UPI001CCA59FB|nr:hypothetical protein [Streptomyces olivaceus]MBZ6259757.1 hypothetical protein [Streptomyces olivaceus]
MYRAKETFWAPGNRRIVKGDLVAEHDLVVDGREGLFEAVVIPQALTPAQAAAARSELPEYPATTGDAESPTETAAPAAPAAPAGDGDSPLPAPAAKKTTAKKTTAPARKPAGGDAK